MYLVMTMAGSARGTLPLERSPLLKDLKNLQINTLADWLCNFQSVFFLFYFARCDLRSPLSGITLR